jgi:hypothetical protein
MFDGGRRKQVGDGTSPNGHCSPRPSTMTPPTGGQDASHTYPAPQVEGPID